MDLAGYTPGGARNQKRVRVGVAAVDPATSAL